MATHIRPDVVQPTVVVTGGIVHFVDFVDSDPEVVQIVSEAEDPETAAHALLRIGGQAARIASTDLDIQLVERRIAGMTSAFDFGVTTAVQSMNGVAQQLLDEETGTLSKVLGGITTDIETLLGDTFDATSKTSVIAKIEEVLTQCAHQLGRNVRATFDLDEPGSPLARTRRDLIEVVNDQVGLLGKEVRELGLAIASKTATASMADKLTSKGTSFEDLLAGGLEPISAIHGDIVRKVGTTTGSAGNKKGDLHVTVAPEDVCGLDAGFVFEAKDRPLSMSKTLAEIDGAMTNHGALAGVAVFARAEHAPVSMPFWFSGSWAILVLDKDEPDLQALHLAYEWARRVTRRSLSADGEAALNSAEVEAGVTRVRQALTKHQPIKACHSSIKKKADEAALHVSALVEEVDQAMRDLLDAINRAAQRKVTAP